MWIIGSILPTYFCEYSHHQNDKIVYFIRSLKRLRYPGQKIENIVKCSLKIKPRSSFEIHERAVMSSVFSLSGMRWKSRWKYWNTLGKAVKPNKASCKASRWKSFQQAFNRVNSASSQVEPKRFTCAHYLEFTMNWKCTAPPRSNDGEMVL